VSSKADLSVDVSEWKKAVWLDVKRVYWTAENWEFLKVDSMVG